MKISLVAQVELILFIFLSIMFASCNMKHNKSINKCLHQVDSHSIPILHFAVLDGDLEKVKCLLKNGVDAMSKDAKGETALMYACRKDIVDFEMVSLLIENGSDILYNSLPIYNSALSICIDKGDLELLSYLINNLSPKEKKIFNVGDFYLGYSITATQARIVEKLITYQGDLNRLDVMGRSFIEIAVDQAVLSDDLLMSEYEWEEKKNIDFDGCLEIIDLLLSSGAKLNESDDFPYIVTRAISGAAVFEHLINQGLDLNRL